MTRRTSSLSTGLVTEYGSTIYAPLAALSAANVALESGNFAEAKTKLEWVIEKSGRPEYDAALARIRLAGVLFDEGKLDDALKTLEAAKPDSTQLGLYHDREGDIWAAKGDPEEGPRSVGRRPLRRPTTRMGSRASLSLSSPTSRRKADRPRALAERPKGEEAD